MNLQTTFSMDSGQVRTGATVQDTFLKMLEEGIVRVTPSIANGIAARYPNVTDLVKGFRKEGALALQDLHVSLKFLCSHLKGFALDFFLPRKQSSF